MLRKAWVVLVALVALVALSNRADAQCGANRTTCTGCHDGNQAPLADDHTWHRDHGFADLCSGCHGGHGDAPAIEQAHADLLDPRADPAARCGPCHGDASSSLALRYAKSTPSTSGGEAPRRPPPSPRRLAAKHGETAPNVLMTALVLLVALAGTVVVRRDHRARKPISPGLGRT